MDTLTRPEEAYRACLASMLDLELEQVPLYEGLSADLQWQAWTASELNLARVMLQDWQPAPCLWLARVTSPYPAYKVHTLVMEHTRIAHDPHPEPQHIDVTMGVLQVDLYVPLDPSLPIGRAALEG